MGQPSRGEPEGALAAFGHDVDYTRFDTRVGRLVPIGLAGLVAAVAASAGLGLAVALGASVSVALGVVVIAIERDRWRAQDVLHWYFAERERRWVADTGGPGPNGDAVGAEIWLGAHQPGAVPQLYRALAAIYTGDERAMARELAALPDETPTDRAWAEWVVQANRFLVAGSADTAELARRVDTLPPGPDREMLATWLALAESGRRHTAGEKEWIRPLADRRARAQAVPLGLRRRARIWLSRFVVVLVFAISASIFTPLALTVTNLGEPVPFEYTQTTYALRGQLRDVDEDSVVRLLPRLARAMSTAIRVNPQPLDEDAETFAINGGLPTFIWTTGSIDIASPPDAARRRVWEIEVLLGSDARGSAIITLDGESGPSYMYRIDPSVVDALRTAVGVPVDGS